MCIPNFCYAIYAAGSLLAWVSHPLFCPFLKPVFGIFYSWLANFVSNRRTFTPTQTDHRSPTTIKSNLLLFAKILLRSTTLNFLEKSYVLSFWSWLSLHDVAHSTLVTFNANSNANRLSAVRRLQFSDKPSTDWNWSNTGNACLYHCDKNFERFWC